MRLINVPSFLSPGNAGHDAILEDFIATFPSYAILSHTWENDEYLFEDLKSGAGQEKRGYKKVRRCCQLAASDGFKYLWVDSCCIDKSSSAELSEAINSMFAWYAKSSVCYTVLSDIDSGEDRSLTIEDLKACRWITRGWTLQELIAPDTVRFFDSNWVECGDRNSLFSLLHEVTNIDTEILKRNGGVAGLKMLFSYSISKRMSWASKRQTTRPEDTAYCLLGIFGVNMPMLYGEGGSRAFVRLQEEIMKHSSDQTILAWSPMDSDQFRTVGVLAESPVAFRNGSKILPAPHDSTFEMTQQGLRIIAQRFTSSEVLSEITTRPDKFSVLLHCFHADNPLGKLAINVVEVKGVSNNQNIFRRVMEPPSIIPLKYLLEDREKSSRSPLSVTTAMNLPFIWFDIGRRDFERSLQGFCGEVERRFQNIYAYLKTEPTSIYITQSANFAQSEIRDIIFCYFRPIQVQGRSNRQFFVDYSGITISDPDADGSGAATIEDTQVFDISILERSKELGPRNLVCRITFCGSIVGSTNLAVGGISCSCGHEYKSNYGQHFCNENGLTIAVDLRTERVSGRLYHIVGLRVETRDPAPSVKGKSRSVLPFSWL